MINKNINVKKGIYNSAMGTIVAITFDDEGKAEYLVIDLDESNFSKEECFM